MQPLKSIYFEVAPCVAGPGVGRSLNIWQLVYPWCIKRTEVLEFPMWHLSTRTQVCPPRLAQWVEGSSIAIAAQVATVAQI